MEKIPKYEGTYILDRNKAGGILNSLTRDAAQDDISELWAYCLEFSKRGARVKVYDETGSFLGYI